MCIFLEIIKFWINKNTQSRNGIASNLVQFRISSEFKLILNSRELRIDEDVWYQSWNESEQRIGSRFVHIGAKSATSDWSPRYPRCPRNYTRSVALTLVLFDRVSWKATRSERRGAFDLPRDISFTVTRPCGPREIASPVDISRLDLASHAAARSAALYGHTRADTRILSFLMAMLLVETETNGVGGADRWICRCTEGRFENFVDQRARDARQWVVSEY